MNPGTKSDDFLRFAELFGKRPSEIKLDLTRMQSAASKLFPDGFTVPSIAIAGTNGKGTTAALIYTILAAMGIRCGLYTSPHILEFKERFFFEGRCLRNVQLEMVHTQLRTLLGSTEYNLLSFFEVATLIAALCAVELKLDAMVWEVGLGGRLDATNVFQHDVSVITSIGLDHTEYLGNSLLEIAREKAGILRQQGVAVVGDNCFIEPGSQAVIEFFDELEHSMIIRRLSRDFHVANSKASSRYPAYMRHNLAIAREACSQFMSRKFPNSKLSDTNDLDSSSILSNAHLIPSMRARFEEVCVEDSYYVLDVSHNLQAVEQLLLAYKNKYQTTPSKILFTLLKDKDVSAIANLIFRNSDAASFYVNDSERALTAEQWSMLFPQVRAHASLQEALNTQNTSLPPTRERPWIICGSFIAVRDAAQCWGITFAS